MYSQFNQASQFLVAQFEEIERVFQGLSRGENLQAHPEALAAAQSMIQDEDSRTPKNTQRIQPSLVFRAINQLVSAFRDGQLQSISPVGPFFASNCDFVCNGMMLFFMDILSVEPGQQDLPFFSGAGAIAEELWLLSLGQPTSSGVLEPLPAGQAVNVQLSDERGMAEVPVDLADLESYLQVHELLVDKIDRAIATEGLNAVIPPGAADKYGHMREMINKRKAMMQGGMRGGARKQAYGTFQGMLAEYTTGSSPLLPGYSAEAMALMKLPVLRVATGEMPGPNIPEPMRIALTSNPGSPDIAQLPAYLANQSLQEWPGASTLPVWVEGENQDSLFSFYTPDMIYYINRAMLFYLGKWPDAPPDAPEGWLKDRKLHRGAGGECERCKDLIRDQLATVIIPRLFLLFEGMVTGAGERVVENPNVAPAWDALKGPLQTTMIATVIRDMNALSINTFLGGMGKTITSDVTGSDGKVMEQSPPIVELNRRVISKIQAVFFKLNTATKAKAADHPLAKALKAITMEEAAKAVSQPLRNFTNQLLKEQCRRIQEDLVKLDGIPLNAANKPSKAESDGYWGPGKLWYAQGMIIDKVAQGKGIGDIDERLLKQFLEATMSSASPPLSLPASAVQPWMKWSDKVGLAKGLTSPAAVWELVTYNLAQGVGITNNANATKIPPDAADKLMLSVNDALKPPGSQGQVGIDCDSGSVCDGMGAFGSCFRGRNSPNYSCQTKNIEIDNDGFTFTVDLKCNSAGNQVKCNYHIGYDGTPQGGGQAGGALGSGQGGYFSSHDLFYVADIGLSAVNRLSANNTMGEALKIIQQQIAAINLGSTATFEELFKKVHYRCGRVYPRFRVHADGNTR